MIFGGCLFVSLCLFVYGILVTSGKHVPFRAKIMIEDENLRRWCQAEGFTKILWGLDLTFFAMYYQGKLFPKLWLAGVIVITIYTILITYKNNQKYMK